MKIPSINNNYHSRQNAKPAFKTIHAIDIEKFPAGDIEVITQAVPFLKILAQKYDFYLSPLFTPKRDAILGLVIDGIEAGKKEGVIHSISHDEAADIIPHKPNILIMGTLTTKEIVRRGMSIAQDLDRKSPRPKLNYNQAIAAFHAAMNK